MGMVGKVVRKQKYFRLLAKLWMDSKGEEIQVDLYVTCMIERMVVSFYGVRDIKKMMERYCIQYRPFLSLPHGYGLEIDSEAMGRIWARFRFWYLWVEVEAKVMD